MIRVVLPAHLRTLARVTGEVKLEVEGQVTLRSALDALEASYPTLLGTLRDHVTQKRRPFVRFFACEQDLSHEPPDTPLPEAVVLGAEPFLIVGAIAGGQEGSIQSATQTAPVSRIPRTSIPGAIFLTGYLGGAVATHVRTGSPLLSHVPVPDICRRITCAMSVCVRLCDSESNSITKQREL